MGEFKTEPDGWWEMYGDSIIDVVNWAATGFFAFVALNYVAILFHVYVTPVPAYSTPEMQQALASTANWKYFAVLALFSFNAIMSHYLYLDRQ